MEAIHRQPRPGVEGLDSGVRHNFCVVGNRVDSHNPTRGGIAMITRLANVKSLLWSVAILLLVTGSDQLGWQAGHQAALKTVEQPEPMARAVYSVLKRLDSNRGASNEFASSR